MSKYKAVQDAIFSIFASVAWKSENIKTFPSNAPTNGEEFIRITIIPSGPGVNANSVSGLLIAEIFTQAGKGPSRAAYIADKLDSYLARATVPNGSTLTQLAISAMVPNGLDKDNPALTKSTFSVPFSYFGVQ